MSQGRGRRAAPAPSELPMDIIDTIDGRLPRRDDLVRVTIEAVDDEGVGVGWLEGCLRGVREPMRAPVAVRDTLPGDVVLTRITARHHGVSSGRVERFEVVSPERVTPACVHAEAPIVGDTFGPGASCGGCTLQGLSYQQQLLQKQRRVERHMREAGHTEPVIASPIGAELRLGHRHKMEYSFGRDPDGGLVLGLHPRGYRWEVLDLTMCPVMSETAFAIVTRIIAAARALGLAHRDERIASGWLETLTIRESRRYLEPSGQPARLVELGTADIEAVETANGSESPRAVAEQLAAAIADSDGLRGFVWTRRRAQRGHPTTRISEVISGQDTLPERLALPDGRELLLHVSSRAFFQPHPRQAERIIAIIVDRLQQENASRAAHGAGLRVADLYCGTGILGLAVAPFVATVVGVELVPEAVADAAANATLNGIDNTHFIAGDVGKVLGDPTFSTIFAGLDAVLLDPPRAGLMPQALGHLATLAAPLVIYVSCNPAALARDIGPLASLGYRLDGPLQPVDLFPHTHHIETVAIFRREPGSA